MIRLRIEDCGLRPWIADYQLPVPDLRGNPDNPQFVFGNPDNPQFVLDNWRSAIRNPQSAIER